MTTDSRTINVNFIDLYTEDENDYLSTINYDSKIGLSFQITRKEYAAIRMIQRELQAKQKEQDAPFRYLSVCVRWEIEDNPNLMMNDKIGRAHV